MATEGGIAIAAPILLRRDFDAASVRRLAVESADSDQVRRLLALAVIYDGGTRTEAATLGGVTLQIVRDWVLRFNMDGPSGLIDGKAPGQPSKLSDAQREALAAKVDAGPIPSVDGVVRWRLKDLAQWIHEEFGISVSEQTVGRTLKSLGFRKISARPRAYNQNEFAQEEFKKIPECAGSDP